MPPSLAVSNKRPSVFPPVSRPAMRVSAASPSPAHGTSVPFKKTTSGKGGQGEGNTKEKKKKEGNGRRIERTMKLNH